MNYQKRIRVREKVMGFVMIFALLRLFCHATPRMKHFVGFTGQA